MDAKDPVSENQLLRFQQQTRCVRCFSKLLPYEVGLIFSTSASISNIDNNPAISESNEIAKENESNETKELSPLDMKLIGMKEIQKGINALENFPIKRKLPLEVELDVENILQNPKANQNQILLKEAISSLNTKLTKLYAYLSTNGTIEIKEEGENISDDNFGEMPT